MGPQGRRHEDDWIPHVPRGWKEKVEKCIEASNKVERKVKDERPVEREFKDIWDVYQLQFEGVSKGRDGPSGSER